MLKIGVLVGFWILIALNPVAIGEKNISNYHLNLFDKSSKNVIDVYKISIGNIKLGMKENEIIKHLGKPKSRTTKYDDICHSAYITTWNYNGLEIEGLSSSNNASQSQVHLITASSSRYPADKGVKVGDCISKAQKAYSKFFSRRNDSNFLAYTNDAYGGLVFSSNKQRLIREIRLVAASC